MASEDQPRESDVQHPLMGVIGAIAGLAMWVLFDLLGESVNNPRLLLWLASATLGFFLLFFALRGGLSWRASVLGAAVLALADAALLYWSSGRFLALDDLFSHSHAPVAWGLILFIGAPFIVALSKGRAGDYALLFDTAWNIVVRYLAAWLFVGLFWGVLHLSDALLSIVGVTWIEDLIDIDPMPYVLTGASLGLGLSVAQDLRAYVSPYLPLRLLRLLLPMVLPVVVIFIIALPARGLTDLFGDLSAAAILMSVAIAGITLITSAIDKNEIEGVGSQFMKLVVRSLALLLPILASLALWAMWLRVSEYGWTPERLAASLAALLVMANASLYGLAVFQGGAWRRMIRQANLGMALLVLVLSVLWMTPIMNAQKMSAHHQLERFRTGVLAPEDLPVWELVNAWGQPGQEVVALLRSEVPDNHQITARLDLAASQSRWEFNRNIEEIDEEKRAPMEELISTVSNRVKIWPEERDLPTGFFEVVARETLEDWIVKCGADADRPCILVIGPFGFDGTETVLFFVPQKGGGAEVFASESGDKFNGGILRSFKGGERVVLSEPQYQQLRAGGFRVGPASRQSLWLGDREISANN